MVLTTLNWWLISREHCYVNLKWHGTSLLATEAKRRSLKSRSPERWKKATTYGKWSSYRFEFLNCWVRFVSLLYVLYIRVKKYERSKRLVRLKSVGRCLFMVDLCNRADHIYFHPVLWSPYGIGRPYIFSCCGLFFFFFLLLLLSFFSSPNLSRRKSDVCHTSTHGVALVRI